MPKLKALKNQNKLGNPIILNYGANGDCPNSYKDKIMDIIGDRKLYWINITNKKQIWFNDKIVKYAENHPNIKIIDWYSASKNHPEYFYKDGIHMRKTGIDPFIDVVFNYIYNDYLEEINLKKQQLIDEHEKILKSTIRFHGNDLLLNNFENLKENFKNSNFMVNKKYDFKTLKKQIEKDIKDNNLNYNVVLAFDSKLKLSNKEYKEILNLFNNNKVYIVNIRNITLELDNVQIIDFYTKIKDNNNYLMADKIHLSSEGNQALNKMLIDILVGDKNEEN